MRSKFSLSFLSLISALFLGNVPAHAAPVASPGALKSKPNTATATKLEDGVTEADIKTVSAMEQSAFGHTFSDDPMDKRLGRLELFTLRARQSGSVAGRLSVLKPALAHKNSVQAAESAGVGKATKSAGDSAKLARLEQNILKKSYPQLGESARLSQLEKKVFGSDFPKLAMHERIERLQKTIGAGESDVVMTPSQPGFSQSYSFSGSINGVPFSMHSNGGTNTFSNNPAVNRQLNDVFNQLNRQMQDMNNMNGMGPGMISPFDFGQGMLPGFGDMVPAPARPNTNRKIVPKQFQQSPIQQSPFQDGADADKNKLPPYLDPNSI